MPAAAAADGALQCLCFVSSGASRQLIFYPGQPPLRRVAGLFSAFALAPMPKQRRAVAAHVRNLGVELWDEALQLAWLGFPCGGFKEAADAADRFLIDCKNHLELPLAYILSIATMFVLPSKALAETCQADNSLMKMPILIAVALVGAAVGGLLARQRREELKRLNDQLRQINTALRRQAKIESFAPGLVYSPVGQSVESEVIVDPKKQLLIENLKTAKKFLRNQEFNEANIEFKKALDLAQALGEPLEEKKAARGLGASLLRQGKYRDAMKYYRKILEISKRTGEDSGNTETYGAIADCYAELGDLEKAAKFYDKYIARLEPNDNE